MASSPALSAPPQAQHAADAARLGRLVEVFPYQARGLVGTALLLGVVFVVMGLSALREFAAGETPPIWQLLVVGGMAIALVWMVILSLVRAIGHRRRKRQICLFEGGLVVVDAGQAQVWAWDEIDGVRQQVTQYRSEWGGDRGRHTRWAVVRRDGRSVSLHEGEPRGADRLGEVIARMTRWV